MVPLTIDFANLHTILGTLYEDMLPLCKDMMDVGKGLAGLGAPCCAPSLSASVSCFFPHWYLAR